MSVSHVCDGCGVEVQTQDRIVMVSYTDGFSFQMDFCSKCATRIRNTAVVKEALKDAGA